MLTTQQKIEAIRDACIKANPHRVWKEEILCGTTAGEYEDLDCRLADVLLATEDKVAIVGSSKYGCFLTFSDFYKRWENKRNISWNLRADDLTQQSEECLDFIHQILFKV